jgi:flagellar basal-body rod modification protein FlgD
MAAAATGIFNHAMKAAQALTGKPAAQADNSTTSTTGSSSDSSNTSSATISANDFLTLLVTEMQNQDPTADTDPNEYIDQLVQVNSLEQLIDINQTLSTDVSGTSADSSATGSKQAVNASPNSVTQAAGVGGVAGAAARLSKAPVGTQSNGIAGDTGTSQSANAFHMVGNLGVPGVNRAAQRVGHALDGRTRPKPATGNTATAGRM